MANKQIYQLEDQKLYSTSAFPVQDSIGTSSMATVNAANLQKLILTKDTQVLTAQGTTSGSTARLIYGVNEVQVSNAQNFCARLPLQPLQGKSVDVVNTSGYILRVFPSVASGSINGIVNGYFDVPSDNLTYTFTCFQNPNPGAWGTTQLGQRNNTTTLQFTEMTLSHTQGTYSDMVGAGTIYSGSNNVMVSPIRGGVGGGSDGYGNILLLPSTPSSSYAWRSETNPALLSGLRVYTNILPSDLIGARSYVELSLVYSYLSGSNHYSTTVTSNNIILVDESAPDASWAGTYQVPSYVPTNNPVLIGDGGTIYGINLGTGYGAQLGTATVPGPNGVGPYYYTLRAYMPAEAITKDYKFRFEIDYI